MFAYMCAFNNLKNPLLLFEEFKDSLTEDYSQTNPKELSEALALLDIEGILKTQRLSCALVGLPTPQIEQNDFKDINVKEEYQRYTELEETLNQEQRYIFNEIIGAVNNDMLSEDSKCFFIDGPGGSGKTYLYNALICGMRGQGKTVLSYATTGIAADLLTDGRTMHSGFDLPIQMLDNSTSSMTIPSQKSEDIRKASAIIIDETSSMHKNALRIIDMLLREIMQTDKEFGGKVLILGGDFRQTANIIHGGKSVDIIEASIKNSPLWKKYFKVFHLTQNMRAKGDIEFNNWLLSIGNGENGEIVEIPEDMIATKDIVEEVFGKHLNLTTDDLKKRAILTTTNKDVLNINNRILKEMPGEEKVYKSIDVLVDETEDMSTNFPLEFLNKQNPTGLPPHILNVKVGAVIMLIRNINIKKGLLNGTRLIVISLHEHFIAAKILTGSSKGDIVYIPKIDLQNNENVLPFTMKRRQFPFIVAFAITINKAQGQTYETVGIYLPKTVFSHGQLYVALSRTQCRQNLKISMIANEDQGLKETKYYTKNVVIKELL